MKPAAVVLASVLLAPVSLAAQTTVDQKRPAAPDGSVSIENMAGSVKVMTWTDGQKSITVSFINDTVATVASKGL